MNRKVLNYLRDNGYTEQFNQAMTNFLFSKGFSGQLNKSWYDYLGSLDYTGQFSGRIIGWSEDNASGVTEVIFTDELSDVGSPPVALTTTVVANQVWQRGKSTLTLEGTYDLSGTPSHMVWRVGSGDWVALQSETIGGGNWSGTIAIPAGYLAQGTFEIKPMNGLNVTPATVAGLTVTDVYVVNGQSNADGYATNLQTYTKVNYDWMVAINGNEFVSKTSDPTWNSGGSVWPAAAEWLDAAGVPPAFVSGATIDGTGYVGGDWNPGDLIYSQAVTRLNNALALTGGCAGEIWWQGEHDSTNGSTEAAYFGASVARRNGFDAEIVNFDNSVPTYLFQLGEHAGSGINEVRAALKRLRAGEDPRFRAGPNLLIMDWGDGTHAGTVQGNVDAAEAESQLGLIAAMLGRSLTQADRNSPVITAAAADQSVFTDILVTFDKNMENHTSTRGWRVTDEGGEVLVQSAAQGESSNQVVLTCLRDLYGTVVVDFGFGGAEQAPVEEIDTILREATAVAGVKLPPEFHEGVNAGTGAGTAPSGVLVNPDFDTSLAGWSQSGNTWQWEAPGVASCDYNRGGAGALNLIQDAAHLTPGATYSYELVISARTGGAVFLRLRGDTSVTSAFFNAPGTYTGTMTCPANPVDFLIGGNSAAILKVSRAYLEEV